MCLFLFDGIILCIQVFGYENSMSAAPPCHFSHSLISGHAKLIKAQCFTFLNKPQNLQITEWEICQCVFQVSEFLNVTLIKKKNLFSNNLQVPIHTKVTTHLLTLVWMGACRCALTANVTERHLTFQRFVTGYLLIPPVSQCVNILL